MTNNKTLKAPLFLQFLKTIWRFPSKVIANFNKKHLKTLWYALQHEPMHVILYNLKKLLVQSDELQQYRIRDHQKGLCLEIESIRFFQGKLEIKGWCATKRAISNFLVETNLAVKINPIRNLFRPDVADHLPNYAFSKNAGFFIVANISGETKEIQLQFDLANAGSTIVNIAIEEDSWAKQYQEILAKKGLHKELSIPPSSSPSIALINIEQSKNASKIANETIGKISAEYCLLVDDRAKIAEDAITKFQKKLATAPAADIIYTDEVYLKENGEQIPYFKSDFNPDLLVSTNYIGSTFLVKKSFGDQLGWLDTNLETGMLYDFLLKAKEQKANIIHLPKALVTLTERPIQNQQHILINYLKRNQIKGILQEDLNAGSSRIKYEIIDNQLVSIIIPFKDQVGLLKACLDSIIEKTEYSSLEILLIDNNSELPTTAEYVQNITSEHSFIRKYSFDEPFNFSKINNWAVQFAKGDFLLFLNNDTEVIERGWLTEMVSHAQRKEVGAVGAKLLYPDNTIQHAGIILGIFGVAEHSHKYFHDTSEGYFHRPNILQNVTAITAACLLTKKSIFMEVNGFDETAFPITLNDVDFCLKLRAKNQLIVYTPYAKLYHFESKSRGGESTKEKKQRAMQEINTFRHKWAKEIEQGDPYYNPNLSYYSTDYQLAV